MLVFEVADGVKTLEGVTPWEGGSSGLQILLLKVVENLSLGPQGACPLAPTTRFAVPLNLCEQRKVGIRGSRWSEDS